MEMRIQNTCEELYWETAKKAVAECKLAALPQYVPRRGGAGA